MPEMIDRQAVLEAICEATKPFEENLLQDRFTRNGLAIARRIIVKQPTIEAEPVRHGRWIDVPDANTKVAKCSLCGFWQRTNGDDKTGKHLIHTAVYRYCSGCGARMDGGADNG